MTASSSSSSRSYCRHHLTRSLNSMHLPQNFYDYIKCCCILFDYCHLFFLCLLFTRSSSSLILTVIEFYDFRWQPMTHYNFFSSFLWFLCVNVRSVSCILALKWFHFICGNYIEICLRDDKINKSLNHFFLLKGLKGKKFYMLHLHISQIRYKLTVNCL